MVRNLDKYSLGSISWRLLATLLCLLPSQIATEKDAENHYNLLTNHGKETFVEPHHFIQVKIIPVLIYFRLKHGLIRQNAMKIDIIHSHTIENST